MYVVLRENPDQNDIVPLYVFIISIFFAVCHILIEFYVLNAERKSYKSNITSYSLACFNGRFSFIPYMDFLKVQRDD